MKSLFIMLFVTGLITSLILEKEGSKANQEDWSKIKYFNVKEFDCPGIPLSGYEMDKEFIIKLDCAREIAGVPFIITSGYRSPSYNRKIGGVSNSSHVTGNGADIKVTTSKERMKITAALIQMGFTRIGLYQSHIHVDNDPTKPQEILYRSNEH